MKTIVRLPNWIGDGVMATPMISRLVESTDKSVSVWGRPHTAGLFHGFPRIDRVIEADEKKDPGILDEVRSQGFDEVFLLTNSYSSAKAAKAAGIPERIGYRRDWRGPLLTRRVTCGPKVRALHMVEYYLNLLPGDLRNGTTEPQPKLYCTEGELKDVRNKLNERFGTDAHQIVGIAPGAAFGSAKQWDPDRFQGVAKESVARGWVPVVFGMAVDRPLGDLILEGAGSAPAWNLAGETTLRELMAFISECAVLVTNDSGPMHLADALSTPSVALFGSTDSTWTGPRANHHIILQSEVACSPCFLKECPLDRQCMTSLTVEHVLAAIEAVFSRT